MEKERQELSKVVCQFSSRHSRLPTLVVMRFQMDRRAIVLCALVYAVAISVRDVTAGTASDSLD